MLDESGAKILSLLCHEQNLAADRRSKRRFVAKLSSCAFRVGPQTVHPPSRGV